MHPVLLEVALPGWRVPLGAALVGVALLCALAAGLGYYGRAPALALAGAAATLASAAAAWIFRGAYLEPSALPVYSFGACLALAFAGGWGLSRRASRRDGLRRDRHAAWAAAALVAGLLGARLLYVALNHRALGGLGAWPALHDGGLSLPGALVAGTLASRLAARRSARAWWRFADAAAPAVALGLGLGAVGSYLAGSDFGRPLGAGAPDWLGRLGSFPHWTGVSSLAATGSPAWLEHVTRRGLPLGSAASLPVHPTQIYDVIAGLCLALGLGWLGPRRRFAGQVFLSLALCYAALRFLLDPLRGDGVRGALGPVASPRVLLGGGALCLAAAATVAPLRGLADRRLRWAAAMAAAAPGLAALLSTELSTRWAGKEALQLSVPQWFCLAAALTAAAAWRVRSAQGSPASPPSGASSQ